GYSSGNQPGHTGGGGGHSSGDQPGHTRRDTGTRGGYSSGTRGADDGQSVTNASSDQRRLISAVGRPPCVQLVEACALNRGQQHGGI
ncbi:MAG: hypothetical protein QG655_3330, partial [Actinomycetota bacterium]|nr:hypothetical protein [Actinomycetota bacterium]